jgi:phosphatidate cytidylyltransferase
LPLLILFILKGTAVQFSFLIIVLSLLGLYEFCQMALPGKKLESALVIISGVPVCLAVWTNDFTWLLLAITLAVLGFSLVSLFRIRDIRQSAGEVALVFLGVLYIPLLLSHLGLVRGLPFGIEWIFLLLVIVMSGDTAAYYTGSTMGKRKLYPVVSPNKSVEGSLGGLAGSILGAFIARGTFFPELSVFDCFAVALLLGCLGQLGDLFESMLKRSFGVKDSGKLIPGHGGILDRLDSILFAAPAAFFYASFVFSPA